MAQTTSINARPAASLLEGYNGMNRSNGEWISGFEHLKQSVQDIITTTIGTRFMRKDYGSNIPRKMGAPMNEQMLAEFRGDIAMALDSQEPRLQTTKVEVISLKAGRLGIAISGVTIDGERVKLDFSDLDF